MSKYPELEAHRDALQAERAKLMAKIDPLRDERDKLAQTIAPTEAKIRELNKRIKEAQGTRLFEIDNQLGGLAKAMGGRSMSHSEQQPEPTA